MAKLKPADLEKLREQMAKVMSLRESEARAKVTVHMGTCGIAAGARQIVKAIMDEIGKRGEKDIVLTTSGCAGLCSREPMMTVEIKGQAPVKYVDLTAEKAKKIFEEHVIGGKIVKEYALAIGSEQVG